MVVVFVESGPASAPAASAEVAATAPISRRSMKSSCEAEKWERKNPRRIGGTPDGGQCSESERASRRSATTSTAVPGRVFPRARRALPPAPPARGPRSAPTTHRHKVEKPPSTLPRRLGYHDASSSDAPVYSGTHYGT